MSFKEYQQYVVMWDCYGLESVVAVPKGSTMTFAALSNQPMPSIPNINMMALRAQFNPQRNYEIYIVSAEDGISADDIREMFESNPQSAAETIRRLGHKFYSDRRPDHKILIR